MQVEALKGGEHNASYLLLCRFYNGTLFEYVQDIGRCGLPQLNPAQHNKLRELSLLTYAKFPHNLTYDKLMELLLVETVAELEEVITNAIYNGLIHGRLDPHGQRVNITSVAPLRDVSTTDIPTLQDTLKEWSDRCTSTLSDLEKQIALVKAEAVERKKKENEWDEFYNGLLQEDSGPPGKSGHPQHKKGMSQRIAFGYKGKRGLLQGQGHILGMGMREEPMDVEMGDVPAGAREDEGRSSERGTRSKKKMFAKRSN